MKRLFLLLPPAFAFAALTLLFFCGQALAYHQQQTGSDEVVVTVHEGEQPVPDVEVTLLLIQYGDLGKGPVTMGTCTTDATGQCSILPTNPPHLEDGWIEGYVDLGERGQQILGWYKGTGPVEVSVLLKNNIVYDEILPTPLALQEGPYDEIMYTLPTDGPAPTVAWPATRTPVGFSLTPTPPASATQAGKNVSMVITIVSAIILLGLAAMIWIQYKKQH